ncbi:MAG: TonB family protein [Pseudomonadota bacterium]
MRTGLAVSAILHAAVLSWGLLNLSEPESFEVDDVEALPVDLVELAEISQVQEGSETAPVDGPAAPDEVEVETPEPDAVNLGDNALDQATPETEEQLPAEVEQARLPSSDALPVPRLPERVEPTPEPEPQPEEPPAAPTTEVAPEPAPQQEVTPDPVAEAIEQAEAETAPEEQFVELPSQLPTIAARPERPQAQTAETPRRENRESREVQFTPPRNNEQDTADDEVAALINRDRGSGGGAAANNQQASRGGERTTSGTTLTQSEMDALRGQIQACWSIPASAQGQQGLRVSVRFNLERSGQLSGNPRITSSSGNRQLDESARRAVLRCGQSGYRLPSDKFDAWQTVIVNFDPSEMFR